VFAKAAAFLFLIAGFSLFLRGGRRVFLDLIGGVTAFLAAVALAFLVTAGLGALSARAPSVAQPPWGDLAPVAAFVGTGVLFVLLEKRRRQTGREEIS
jgi:hypothetical protein